MASGVVVCFARCLVKTVRGTARGCCSTGPARSHRAHGVANGWPRTPPRGLQGAGPSPATRTGVRAGAHHARPLHLRELMPPAFECLSFETDDHICSHEMI